MIELAGVPQSINELLTKAGVTSAASVLEMGEEGLVAIAGIGKAYAQQILAAAREPVASTTESEFDATTPNLVLVDDEPESVDEPTQPEVDGELAGDLLEGEMVDEPETSEVKNAEMPPSPGDPVVVKLVGASAASLGLGTIYKDQVHTVPYQHYLLAAANHPGAFLVRRPGDNKFRQSL